MLPATTSPELHYESSTPTSKELSSPIFQSLSVSESVREASVTPDLTCVFVYILYLCICVFLCLCIYVFAAVWWPSKGLKERWRRVPKTSHFGFSPLTCAQTPELLLCENPNLGRFEFDAKISPFPTPVQLSLDTFVV